jgi:hypothetical protein
MTERRLKDDLSDFLSSRFPSLVHEDYTYNEAAGLILDWLAEEYDRQIEEALGEVTL